MNETIKPTFASDNFAPVHPEVMRALVEANEGPAPAYGNDPWTARLEVALRALFRHPELRAFPVFNGTGANLVALSSVLRPYESVLCAESAHIVVDECGAVERITGSRLVTFPTTDGKLTPALLEPALKRRGDIHHAQPRVISVSQSTEYGTVYTVAELRALADFAHAQGMLLHVDGSRAANAVVSLRADFHATFVATGVDLLSLGGTKNGAMGAEAIVVLDPALARETPYFRKQCTQLSSKQRYVSAQLLALFGTDLWRANASHANELAAQLADGLRKRGLRLTQSVDANAIFVEMPKDLASRLQSSFSFYVWNEPRSEYRLMTSFATDADSVERFVTEISRK